MAYLDDQEIQTLPSPPPITTETTATTTTPATVTATVNLLVSDSTLIKSLFAMAVFLSLSLNTNPSKTLSPDPACAPTDDNLMILVIWQLYALTSFIFSAITAFSLRNASCSTHHDVNNIKGSNLRFHRIVLLLSDIGFVLGAGFLLMAIVSLAEMKLGTVSCGTSSVTLVAVVPLQIFVPSSIAFFISSSISAFKAK